METRVEEFCDYIEIADIAKSEDKLLKMAYWVGRATELTEMFTDDEFRELHDRRFPHYHKWTIMRVMCQQI